MCALSFFRRPAAVCLALVLALAGVCWSPAVTASGVSCNGHVSNLVFGDVSLANGGVVNTSATLTYGCSGAQPGDRVLVCVGLGANPTAPGMGSMVPRYLKRDYGGGQTAYLAFNLYSDPARTTVWGDFGSAGYQPQAFILQYGAGQYYVTQTQTVYGQIKTQGQAGLPYGLYNTTAIGGWPVHLKATKFNSPTPPACSTGDMSELSFTGYFAANVKSDCRIEAVSDLDFGTVFQTLDQNIDSTATLAVTCSLGSSYTVSLGYGSNSGGTQQRQMQGPGGALLKYGLYENATRSGGDSWPSGGVPLTGNGQPQQLTIYGRVSPQTVPAPGVYSDTVVVTVSY